MPRSVLPVFHSLLLIVFVGSFSSIAYYLSRDSVPPAAPVLPPTAIPATLPPVATAQPGWTLLQPGLEQRVIDIAGPGGERVESLHIWRLDQARFRMDVAFDRSPRTLDAWQQQTGALIVLNGGYYSVEGEIYRPDGLVVLNGEASGRSFNGSAGMLAITEGGADVRWLGREPYDPAEPLRAALQSFPVLVRPGGEIGVPAERESHAAARRTVLAQDRSGRILLMAAPEGHFTLHRLSAFLASSDLDLDTAINLDGGGSTGILVAEPRQVIPSDRPLPFVILVHPRP